MLKKVVFPLMLIAVCVLACACFAGNQTDTAPNAAATPDASPAPGQGTGSATATPGVNGGSANGNQAQNGMGAAPGFDWVTGSGAVADRINMFSEIDECSIVENEGTALVGVEFASAYQGELTQRIRDMVAGEVMAADSSVQVVAVTSEKDDVAKIKELAGRVSSGDVPQDIKQQIDMIARNTTTLR